MRTEPTAVEVDVLLEEIDASSARVVVSLGALDHAGLLAPTLLPEWARITIAAHLTFVPDRYVAMTADALAGISTTTYPGGPAERSASLRAFHGVSDSDALRRFNAAATALRVAWQDLEDGHWSTTLDDDRFGPIRLAMLPALRLTELEVHHVDLDVGYQVADWPEPFARVCLPLRLAWLDTYHRRRPDADRSITGTWLLAPTDGLNAWLVDARADSARSQPAPTTATADVVLSGRSASLLAFVLGRQRDPTLIVSVNREMADAFKRAFPGP